MSDNIPMPKLIYAPSMPAKLDTSKDFRDYAEYPPFELSLEFWQAFGRLMRGDYDPVRFEKGNAIAV